MIDPNANPTGSLVPNPEPGADAPRPDDVGTALPSDEVARVSAPEPGAATAPQTRSPETTPNEPPMVVRPARRKPGPGFWEALGWCVLFVAAQMFGLIVTTCSVFVAYAVTAPDAKDFAAEQLDTFVKAVAPPPPGQAAEVEVRPAIPRAIGSALAWGMLAAQVVSLGLILIVFPRRIGPDWKRQLGVRAPRPLHVGLVLLIVPGFLIGADTIQTLVQWATGIEPPQAMKALNGIFGAFPWPLTALAVAIGPGVVEELWCRGLLGRGLCARYGLRIGVPTTAALFAAMHVDPSQLVVITAMGVYLHLVYLATRSIWMPMLLHASNNGLAVLLALSQQPSETEVKVIPIIVHFVALALLFFGGVALRTSRMIERPVAGDRAKGHWTPEYPGISAPPAGADVELGYAELSPMALLFTVVSFGVLLGLAYRFVL
jgi:membrane protease YdiL (CAAX protease family)